MPPSLWIRMDSRKDGSRTVREMWLEWTPVDAGNTADIGAGQFSWAMRPQVIRCSPDGGRMRWTK